MTYAVIMAGGIGSRFWPTSRQARPKQFLNVFGDASLIQGTLGRLQGLVPPERCFILTHERYVEQTRDQLPAVPPENILAEPISRNTAPCIAYAATRIYAQDPEATMIVLPADHLIQNVREFHNVLNTAVDKAQEQNALVTIGITPTHPETGYGYIQYDVSTEIDGQLSAYAVKTFAEKPNLETAERFLASGDFVWNSGMFIWRADSILSQIESLLPDIHTAFKPVAAVAGTDQEKSAVKQAFQDSPKISIDYGIMEKAPKVYLVPGDFGWNDVGDWRAVYDLAAKNESGNALTGNVIMQDAENCYVEAGEKLVVLVGLKNTIVVDTDDAILVCDKESTQKVKNVVEYLRAHQLTQYT